MTPEERAEHVDEAIARAWDDFDTLTEATTIGGQGRAMDALMNSMSDLITWHPRFNGETGTIEEEG